MLGTKKYQKLLHEKKLQSQTEKKKMFKTMTSEARVRWFERLALQHTRDHMQNRWPVQIWCMEQGTQSWCSGQPRGIGWGGRWEGASGWGVTCIPMANIMLMFGKQPSPYRKGIILQLRTINSLKQRHGLRIQTNQHPTWPLKLTAVWHCARCVDGFLKQKCPQKGWGK